jgi:hypothetical protein
MTNTQQRIISLLQHAAEKSPQVRKHAAAICAGSKILNINVNTHRSKFGREIRCCAHSEIACLHDMFPYAFKHKVKKQCVH